MNELSLARHGMHTDPECDGGDRTNFVIGT
jgi:hypothetical protein